MENRWRDIEKGELPEDGQWCWIVNPNPKIGVMSCTHMWDRGAFRLGKLFIDVVRYWQPATPPPPPEPAKVEAKYDPEVHKLIKLGHRLGWDGVSNPKALSAFFESHIAELERKREVLLALHEGTRTALGDALEQLDALRLRRYPEEKPERADMYWAVIDHRESHGLIARSMYWSGKDDERYWNAEHVTAFLDPAPFLAELERRPDRFAQADRILDKERERLGIKPAPEPETIEITGDVGYRSMFDALENAAKKPETIEVAFVQTKHGEWVSSADAKGWERGGHRVERVRLPVVKEES